MDSMFSGAISFNQDLSLWNTGSVTNMRWMFNNTPFDQNIGVWNVSGVTDMESMFKDATLSTLNYNALLISYNFV